MPWSSPSLTKPRAYRRRRPVAPDPGLVATRLCQELEALTGSLESNVNVEVLMGRMKIGPDVLERGLAFAAERDWISRTPETAALRAAGRQEALRFWPVRLPTPVRHRRKN
ncbi:hypothetical protein [Reyranella sp.]|jgi:hypothetical protein|uniref:hypothetical protein n=1 Tax=Reyranella sp. TaxID=1929291 RepID=UPI002F93F721